jgi:hypothetical protein
MKLEQKFCFGQFRVDKHLIKYILSRCIKTLLNVVNDHVDNGIFRAVRSADKPIKAHCLPLE